MSSDSYARFEREYLDDRPRYANEGIAPVWLIDELDAGERVRAEARLIDLLKSWTRELAWPAEGLAHLASQAAVPALFDALERAHASEKASLALAIHRIRPDDARRALPLLHDTLERARGARKAELAAAIWRISADEAMVGVLLELAGQPLLTRWIPGFLVPMGGYEKLQVIHRLGELLPHESARERLRAFSHDRRMLISSNARRILLTHDLEQQGLSKEEVLRRVLMQL